MFCSMYSLFYIKHGLCLARARTGRERPMKDDLCHTVTQESEFKKLFNNLLFSQIAAAVATATTTTDQQQNRFRLVHKQKSICVLLAHTNDNRTVVSSAASPIIRCVIDTVALKASDRKRKLASLHSQSQFSNYQVSAASLADNRRTYQLILDFCANFMHRFYAYFASYNRHNSGYNWHRNEQYETSMLIAICIIIPQV